MNKYILNIVFLFFGLYSYAQIQNDSSKIKLTLVGKVADTKLGTPLDSVVIIIWNENTDISYSTTTDSNGFFSFLIDRSSSSFDILLVSEDYIAKKLSFKIIDSSYVNLNDLIDLDLINSETNSIVCGISIEAVYHRNNQILFDSIGKIELDKLIYFMYTNPEVIIEAGSHTDCIGTKSSNLRLSNKRAKVIRDYVISKGISKERIIGKGYGESRPLNKCDCNENNCSEKDYSTNRRTEFRIVRGEDVNKINSF